MQSLLTYISGLVGVFVLFLQLWQFAPLDRALLTAALTGLGAFLVLHLGYWVIQWILTLAPPRDKANQQHEENTSERAETDTLKPASRMTEPAAA